MKTFNIIRTALSDYAGLWLGVATLALRWMMPASFIEQYYSRGVFQSFRAALDHTLSRWSPVPLLYLFVLVLLYWAYRRIRAHRKQKDQTFLQKLFLRTRGTLNFIGLMVALFLLMWGYNYGRESVEKQLALPEMDITVDYVAERVQSEARDLAALRKTLTQDQQVTVPDSLFPENQENLLREALEKTFNAYGFPTIGRVRGRVLKPRGIFLRFSSAGLYFPWTGEGHIDAGLLPIQQPYTMAHEMSHGYGFGDEGTCSFWAVLASDHLDNDALEYAIRLGYWRTLASAWRRGSPDAYTIFYEQMLDDGMKADLNAISTNNAKYPDLMPTVRDAAYEAYLKSQGIAEGLKNYSKVMNLVEAWREKQNTE